MGHDMLRANHDIVSCLDDLALRQPDSILLDDLLDDSLGHAGSGCIGAPCEERGGSLAMAQRPPALQSHPGYDDVEEDDNDEVSEHETVGSLQFHSRFRTFWPMVSMEAKHRQIPT